MSVNTDSSGLSYSDHDVHHVNHSVRILAGSGGDDVFFRSNEQFEITERGLDPDELAELRAMRISIGPTAGAGENQTQRGEFSFTVEAGFNMSEGEALSTGSSSTTTDTDSDGTDEINVVVNDTDEVGQIYAYNDNFNIGYEAPSDSAGAAGTGNSNTEVISMSELFGSGPYVDAADDFNSQITVRPENVVEKLGVEVTYSLYYDVSQVEGGRTRFGR